MLIAIINGPNLNLLGNRQPEVYGTDGWLSVETELIDEFKGHTLIFKQSNLEGEIIDYLHQHGLPGMDQAAGIVLNAGGYSHTSVAIADAVAAIKTPVISVHISNIYTREQERHKELIAQFARGGIYGLGTDVYRMAVDWLIRHHDK
jgi:3-dehydroquinate dehydratase II